jgi:hypothetical protein
MKEKTLLEAATKFLLGEEEKLSPAQKAKETRERNAAEKKAQKEIDKKNLANFKIFKQKFNDLLKDHPEVSLWVGSDKKVSYMVRSVVPYERYPMDQIELHPADDEYYKDAERRDNEMMTSLVTGHGIYWKKNPK